MPKVEAIINDLQYKTFQELPEVSHILQSDIDRLNEALKKQKNDRSYYAVLRVVLSEVKKKLGHNDYIKPLLQISLSQLQGKPYIHDLKLIICQAIIDCEQLHRINLLQHTINALTSQNIKNPFLRARLQIIRAGKQFFKGDYSKAAMCYLNASRQQAFVKDQNKKIQLVNKAIAFSYIAPRCSQNHKTICSLCLNDLSKKSPLKDILNKLYMENIMSNQDCQKIQTYLPRYFKKPDIDEISILNQAKFSHNMIPIMNSFKNISFKTLTKLLCMDEFQVLKLLEKTSTNGNIKIDQQNQFIQFLSDPSEGDQRLKQFLDKIDEILEVKQ